MSFYDYERDPYARPLPPPPAPSRSALTMYDDYPPRPTYSDYAEYPPARRPMYGESDDMHLASAVSEIMRKPMDSRQKALLKAALSSSHGEEPYDEYRRPQAGYREGAMKRPFPAPSGAGAPPSKKPAGFGAGRGAASGISRGAGTMGRGAGTMGRGAGTMGRGAGTMGRGAGAAGGSRGAPFINKPGQGVNRAFTLANKNPHLPPDVVKEFSCGVCNIKVTSMTCFKQHIAGKKHLDVLKKKTEECSLEEFTAEIVRDMSEVSKENDGDEDQTGKPKPTVNGVAKSTPDSNTDSKSTAGMPLTSTNPNSKGLEHIQEVTGYFCKLCQRFFRDKSIVANVHCASDVHLKKLAEKGN